MSIPRSEFPRPDLQRDNWTCLNGVWAFSFDEPVFDKEILAPFCYQSEKSGIGCTENHDTVWYRRSFSPDAEKLSGRRLLLKFGAVDYEADVWVNGRYAGRHVGGYSPFSFDITTLVQEGENELCVRVHDDLGADRPRGKQSWKDGPFACWYTPVTGIWQSVWLEYTAQKYVERVKSTPDVRALAAMCEVFAAEGANGSVRIRAYVRGEKVSESCAPCRFGYARAVLSFAEYETRLSDILWSPETPNLIDLEVELDAGGAEPDAVKSYFGMRSVEARAGRILLNGSRCFERLILDQGYWPDTLLTPPDDEAIRRDIRLVQEMGFNGVRKHQKLEDPRFYYWADRMGLLVWGELPSAYLFNDRAIRAGSEAAFDFLERDYNHPCIITWVPANESWGISNVRSDRSQQEYCRMLTSQLHALDPTRLVSANDGWEQVEQTDLCAIHDYSLAPESCDAYEDWDAVTKTQMRPRLVFADGNSWRGQPVMITEFGGIAFETGEEDDSWGYNERAKSDREFCDRLAPVVRYLSRDERFAGFCYTQLTDVMQETNGLLTPEREPKIPIDALRAIFCPEKQK